MNSNSLWTLLWGAPLVLSLMSGCTSDQLYEYRAHTDKVTEGAGNANAANQAIQTVDTWPVYSQKTEANTDGKRVMAAVRRYEADNNKRKELSADATATNNGGVAPR
jgi:hypothetical protein